MGSCASTNDVVDDDEDDSNLVNIDRVIEFNEKNEKDKKKVRTFGLSSLKFLKKRPKSSPNLFKVKFVPPTIIVSQDIGGTRNNIFKLKTDLRHQLRSYSLFHKHFSVDSNQGMVKKERELELNRQVLLKDKRCKSMSFSSNAMSQDLKSEIFKLFFSRLKNLDKVKDFGISFTTEKSKIIDKYKVLSKIGVRSCSSSTTVKKVMHIETKEVYVMKILNLRRYYRDNLVYFRNLKKLNEEDISKIVTPLDQIINEIVTLSWLNHDNIIKLHEVGINTKKNKVYIIQQYAEGGILLSLDENFYDNVEIGFNEDRCRSYFKQLITTVGYLHHNRIVHRDIKPSNILLSKNRQKILLCDFGMAKIFTGKNFAGACSDTKGTHCFFSPEMCSIGNSKFSGYFHDIWCCGITLYSMLFGRLPFIKRLSQTNLNNISMIFGIHNAILKNDLYIPKNKEVSDEVVDLLTKLLKKDPVERLTQISEIMKHPWMKNV